MKFLKDSMIYLAGELVSKSIPFLLLPYLTRNLGTNGFGELSYYLVLISLLVVFIGLSQDGAITRYYYRYGKKSLSLVVVSSFVSAFSISILVIFIAFIYKSELLFYIVLCALTQTLLASQLAIRQCQKEAKSYIIIQIVSALLSVFFTVLFFTLFLPSPFMRIIGVLLSNFLTVILAYLFFRKENKKNLYSWAQYRLGVIYIFSFGFPLVFHQLSLFIKGQADRLFIAQKFSLSDLGVYSAGAQIASIFTILVLAVNKACVPYLYEKLKNKTIVLAQLKSFTKISLFLIPLPALFALIIPASLYQFILGADFSEAKYYTTIFLLGLAFNIPYLILVNYLFYFGQNKKIAIFTTVSSVCHLLLLFGFSLLGLQWIPFATVFSNIILLILLYNQIREY